MSNAAIHPTPQVLSAFGMGKLPEAAVAVIASHLESCSACREAVARLSSDSFVHKVRDAEKEGASFPPSVVPSGNLSGTVYQSISIQPRCPDAPPELARNPKFLVLRELGRGGMGVVYQARQLVMNRQVVIKVINRALLEQPGALDRFHREIRAAAQLSHPNIVAAYDAEEMGDLHVLVMEFVPGQSLAEVLRKKGPLPVSAACHYMRQAALGLQHAHERGMVHRDIKPDNMMLTPSGQVKILDFGLAKLVSERSMEKGLTSANAYMGTPDYSAPEQATDARSADIRADLYSLGCTLYCLLTGQPPFDEETAMKTILAHLQKEPRPLRELRPDVPEELWQVVKRLLAKDPAERYQKPVEVFRALCAFVKPEAQGSTAGGSSSASGMESVSSGTAIKADTAEIKEVLRGAVVKAARVEPPPAPPVAHPVKPQPESAAIWESLAENNSPPPETRQSGVAGKLRSLVAQLFSNRKWRIGGSVAVGVLLLALVGMWAGGVFKVKTKHGTIVLENLPAGAEVLVDGETVTLKAGDGKSITITARKKHQVQVKKEGFKVYGTEVEIDAGERRPIRVTLQREPQKSSSPPSEPTADDKGFVPLFNGKDLTGWKTHPDATGDWKVEKGILIGRGPHVSHLYSQRGDYVDFDLLVEAKINQGGNSGVLFHKAFTPDWKRGYEAQIDSSSHKFKTGTLYVKAAPGVGIEKVLVPVDTWFTQEVIVQGNHIIIKINGVKTADFVDVDNTWPGGHIALQVFDAPTVVQFRRIELKELSTPKRDDQGFVPLFNGKDLTGWKTHPTQPGNWRAERGVLIGSSNGVSHLYTERGEYQNFHLRMEARINDGGNSGVYFRAPFGPSIPNNSGQPTWVRGYNAKLDMRRFGGLLIDDLPLIRDSEIPATPGTWVTFEVIAEGNRLTVKMNGSATAEFTDEKRRYTEGHIVLQQHGAGTVVEFRKIEIKELEPKKPRREATIPPADKRLAQVTQHGKWIVNPDGVLVQTKPRAIETRILFGDKDWTDYDFEFEFRIDRGGMQIGGTFRMHEWNDNYEYLLGTPRFAHEFLQDNKGKEGWEYLFGRNIKGLEMDRWYKVKVRVRGTRYECYLDGEKRIALSHDRHRSGCVGFRAWAAVCSFRSIRVTAPDGEVLWEGPPIVP